ncbi:MAG: efflux RND transporter periplasmic adaptor subunit [Candidatus Krumholzibacteriia bacterium]
MKRRGTWVVLLLLAAVVAVLLVAGGCGRGRTPAVLYHCPMHPTYVSDRPGDCPICGMRLVPIPANTPPTPPAPPAPPVAPAATDRGSAGPSAARRALYYRSPMDPRITSPVPAKDAMGMDFVPVYAGETTGAVGGAPAVPGLAVVAPGAEALQMAGVRTAPAVRERLARTIRATAVVAGDETRVRRVQVRVGGWVERLFVDFTGRRVRAGEPLLSLYSPELLATQEEYVRARQAAARFAASDLPEVRQGGADLVTAARRRLELRDVPAAFIAELDRTGQPQRAVTLTAPGSGYVTAKEVFAGQRVEPGMELFTVADLDTVWVEAQLYEADAPLVAVGQAATLGLPYDTAPARAGRITFVSPTLDPDTRTLQVRLEFANRDLRLRPGMFATVQLQVDLGDQLVVPDDAVMDTGERQYVFVAAGDGAFAPRAVTVGWRGDGRAQILTGLAAGEQVAMGANFLLDSESRLRAAVAGTPAPAPATTAGGPDRPGAAP